MPASLRTRIEEAVRACELRVASCSVPDALRTIAESLITDAMSAPEGSRDTAMTVLAADAMVTYACEATAEVDPSALADLR